MVTEHTHVIKFTGCIDCPFFDLFGHRCVFCNGLVNEVIPADIDILTSSPSWCPVLEDMKRDD